MNSIDFKASEEWSVADLYRFFQQLNILYNRIYVISHYIPSALRTNSTHVRGLDQRLLSSLSEVPKKEQLKVSWIEIHSPAKFSFEGVGGIIKEVREWIMDAQYRRELDKQEKTEQLEHQREMNSIESEKARVELFCKKVEALKKAGLEEKEIQRLLLPSEKIAEMMSQKQIEFVQE